MIWPMVRNSGCPQDVQDNGVEYGVLVSIDVVTGVRYHLHSAILQAWLLYTVDTVTGVSIDIGGHNIHKAIVLLYRHSDRCQYRHSDRCQYRHRWAQYPYSDSAPIY